MHSVSRSLAMECISKYIHLKVLSYILHHSSQLWLCSFISDCARINWWLDIGIALYPNKNWNTRAMGMVVLVKRLYKCYFIDLWYLVSVLQSQLFDSLEPGRAIIIRTLHGCPLEMNENFMISKLICNANHQIWVHLWGTIMLCVYYIVGRITVGEQIDTFK